MKKIAIIIFLLLLLVLGINYSFSIKEVEKEYVISEVNSIDDIHNREINVIYPDFTIVPNGRFHKHNTSVRTRPINYIVIHYTGEENDAAYFVNKFNESDSRSASADFFVGFNGDIYQYNMMINSRYSWAVGGKRNEKTMGGSLYGNASNENSVSIEMSVYSGGAVYANESGWYLTDETIDSTIKLTKYLMKKYNVPVNNVIRHYDVTGKLCPGIIGWNLDSGSEEKWEEFKTRLE